MRGKVFYDAHTSKKRRITPAYAGKRGYALTKGHLSGDHPRLCGEKLFIYIVPWFDVGSPPPMRGKVDCTLRAFHDLRITPAYAGKSIALVNPFHFL